MILQSRVNPASLKVIATGYTKDGHSEYWLLPDERDIRPYGVCKYEC